MPTHIYFDSDDERDDFDIERRLINTFQNKLISASIESSEDDDEGIIDGTKVPSSTKLKQRARHSFLDISTLSSSSSLPEHAQNDEVENEQNPFDIISKSIDIENIKPMKKRKSLGVPKSRVLLDSTDVYDQDESNHSRKSNAKVYDGDDDEDHIQPNRKKSTEKSKIRKPTKAAVLETERKMQQLSRSEHLVLPTFVPKPLETWHALEKRSRQELMNEIRAKNPSFTPQDPELPELPVVDAEPTAASTLADLTKLIDDKPKPVSNTLNKLSRFLNPDILKKKPTMSTVAKESVTMIDLTDTSKAPNHPSIKSTFNVAFDAAKSPSSSKKLFEMQKQLGIRMQAKRAAMLAENVINIKDDDEEEEEEDEINEVDDDSMDTTNESNDANSEVISTIDKENDDFPVDEETRQSITDEEENDAEEEEEEQEEEEKENTQSTSNPNRPSLKTILTRLESSSEPIQPQPVEQNGQTEWFNSARPAQFDSELEMLCSGAFGGDDIIPVSQNFTRPEPMAFSPLPPTQNKDIEQDEDIVAPRPKVRQLIDDDDEDSGSKKQSTGSSSNDIENSEDENEEQDEQENEELIDYKKQLFEMEAEESGSDIDEKDKDNDDESDSDDDDEGDEELRKFIDTAAVEIDEDEADSMAKVHLKIKAKEDEHQLKLLKEQYLDFDGEDDGRRIKLSKNPRDDDNEEEDDPDYNSEMAEEEDDDDEDEEEDPTNLKDRMSELERQRSIQDTQAEELHLDEDLDSIGQNSLMFKKGLVLKQKRIQSTTTSSHVESTTQIATTSSTTKKTNQTRSVTLSSVLLAKRFSSALLVPNNRSNVAAPNSTNTNETTMTTKKQHNPRRHVFATNVTSTASTNENQNPIQPSTSSGEKRSNSTDKSPKTNIKRFKQSTTTMTTTTTTSTVSKEPSTSVFSALALSNTRR
ncbi:unnamed protein product [Adineta ricciae]|nr:unnamed protein product [Adineta ricciae]